MKGSEGVIIIKMRGKANVKCFSKILSVKYFTQICLG